MSDTFDNPAARTAAEFQKLCDSVHSTIPAPPGTIAALKTFTENYKRIISVPTQNFSKMLEDFQAQISRSFYQSDSYRQTCEKLQKQIAEMFSGVSLSPDLNDRLNHLNKTFVAPQLAFVLKKEAVSPVSTSNDDREDYVVIPEDAIIDIVCPDVIAIPLPGQRRFKIKTETFIALLALLATFVQMISSFFPNDQQPIVQNYYNIQIQTLEYNADYSSSSLKNFSSDLQSVLEDIHPEDDSSE